MGGLLAMACGERGRGQGGAGGDRADPFRPKESEERGACFLVGRGGTLVSTRAGRERRSKHRAGRFDTVGHQMRHLPDTAVYDLDS